MEDTSEIEHSKTGDILQHRRDAAALELGLDPSIIAWPVDASSEAVEPRGPRWNEPLPFDDTEWGQVAACFPPEPPQAGAIANRAVFDAVLRVVAGERAWSVLDGPAMSAEAVRKKFARLARKGVWQQLAAASGTLDLSESRRSQLRAIGPGAADAARLVRARPDVRPSVEARAHHEWGASFTRSDNSGPGCPGVQDEVLLLTASA